MELPVSAKVAMVLLAVACVGLGLAAHIPVEFIRQCAVLMGGQVAGWINNSIIVALSHL